MLGNAAIARSDWRGSIAVLAAFIKTTARFARGVTIRENSKERSITYD